MRERAGAELADVFRTSEKGEALLRGVGTCSTAIRINIIII